MRKKYISLAALNTVSFLVVLFVNYIVQTHTLTSISMAEVSHKYDTLFTPADYAFFVWLIIYVQCAVFVIYQWRIIKNDTHNYIGRTGIWFTMVNFFNALWCYCWVHEWLGWCVIIMLCLLLSLIRIAIKLRLELDDEPVKTIFFIWWPMVNYLGWIVSATVACIASWLVYTGWATGSRAADTWTIIMIAAACLIYIFLVLMRNMREAAGIGVWAFVAIAVKQWNQYTNIAIAAIFASVILLLITGWHGFKNRYFGPQNKIKRGEW